MNGTSHVAARTGCDVQGVAAVEAALLRWGQRYLDRVYTSAEQAECRAGGATSLAGRFAAKEAVLKLCGRPDGVDPRWVEITADSSGRPQVRLHSRAAGQAAALELGRIDVSIAHDSGIAMAVAVALTGSADLRRDRRSHHAAPHDPEHHAGRVAS